MKQTVTKVGVLCFLGLGAVAYGQQTETYKGKVGINTEQPSATLHIQPNAENGKETATTNEGIIAPKLSKTRVAAIATPVEGTQVYVTDDTASPITAYTGTNDKVNLIKTKGYYFYDGFQWANIVDSKWILNPTAKIMYTTYLSDGITRRTNEQNLFITDTGNLGIGINHPQQRLVVNGDIRSISLAQTGKGDRVVYADENGVLKVGTAGATTVGNTAAITCDETNVGKINYGDIRFTDNGAQKTAGAFGFCTKKSDGTFAWAYIVGGANVFSGTGEFGTGL